MPHICARRSAITAIACTRRSQVHAIARRTLQKRAAADCSPDTMRPRIVAIHGEALAKAFLRTHEHRVVTPGPAIVPRTNIR